MRKAQVAANATKEPFTFYFIRRVLFIWADGHHMAACRLV